MYNDFEWMNDVPAGDFTAETMADFFEFAQVGDEVYMHGTMGMGYSLNKYDCFGKIVGIQGIKVHIQTVGAWGGKSVLRFNIPKIYEKVPELWVQEQGFVGDHKLITEVEVPYKEYGNYDYRVKTTTVIFNDIVTLLKHTRFTPHDYYGNIKIHLIDREM